MKTIKIISLFLEKIQDESIFPMDSYKDKKKNEKRKNKILRPVYPR